MSPLHPQTHVTPDMNPSHHSLYGPGIFGILAEKPFTLQSGNITFGDAPPSLGESDDGVHRLSGKRPQGKVSIEPFFSFDPKSMYDHAMDTGGPLGEDPDMDEIIPDSGTGNDEHPDTTTVMVEVRDGVTHISVVPLTTAALQETFAYYPEGDDGEHDDLSFAPEPSAARYKQLQDPGLYKRRRRPGKGAGTDGFTYTAPKGKYRNGKKAVRTVRKGARRRRNMQMRSL